MKAKIYSILDEALIIANMNLIQKYGLDLEMALGLLTDPLKEAINYPHKTCKGLIKEAFKRATNEQ